MISKLITELRARRDEIAEAALSRPKSELFEYGRVCGQYQEVQNALNLIDSLLRDEHEKEISS